MTISTSRAIDDILALLEEPLVDYRTLYYRWEQERWEAGAIDLSVDREQWSQSLAPELKGLVLWTLTPLHAAAQLAVTALVPVVDAAPAEEQQVLLTTQLADVARHVVLLDRFYSEVSTGATRPGAPHLEAPEKTLVDVVSASAARIERDEIDSLIEAILTYHLVVEGALGLTLLRFLVNHAHSAQCLPGLTQSLTAVTRDHVRHVQFALRFLSETIGRDASRKDTSHIVQRLTEALTRFFDTIPRAAASRDQAPYSAQDLRTFALALLHRMLERIGARGMKLEDDA